MGERDGNRRKTTISWWIEHEIRGKRIHNNNGKFFFRWIDTESSVVVRQASMMLMMGNHGQLLFHYHHLYPLPRVTGAKLMVLHLHKHHLHPQEVKEVVDVRPSSFFCILFVDMEYGHYADQFTNPFLLTFIGIHRRIFYRLEKWFTLVLILLDSLHCCWAIINSWT